MVLSAPKIGGIFNKKYGVGRPRKKITKAKIKKFVTAIRKILGK